MAEKLFCPNCNKHSYTSAIDVYSPCPYCGFMFSGIDFDRRTERRFSWSAECHIFAVEDYNHELFTANIQDISNNGAKIKYAGEMLTPKSRVDIHVMNLNLSMEARVEWIKTADNSATIAGLQFAVPMLLPEAIW